MAMRGDTMQILQGRTFAPDINKALDNIHERLESMGLTGEPRVWMAPVQVNLEITWFEYLCECKET